MFYLIALCNHVLLYALLEHRHKINQLHNYIFLSLVTFVRLKDISILVQGILNYSNQFMKFTRILVQSLLLQFQQCMLL